MSLRRVNRKLKEMKNPAIYEEHKRNRIYLMKRYLKKVFWSVLFMIALKYHCMFYTSLDFLIVPFIYFLIIIYLIRELLFIFIEIDHM